MGAGVGAAEDDAGVPPHLGPPLPRLVGDAHLGTSEGSTVSSGRRSGSTTSMRTSTGSASRSWASDAIDRPTSASCPGGASAICRRSKLRAAVRPRRRPRRRPATARAWPDRRPQAAAARRQAGPRRPAHRHVLQHAVGPHAHDVGQRERDDVGALLVACRRTSAAGRRSPPATGAEQVPVQRPVGGQRHRRHQRRSARRGSGPRAG